MARREASNRAQTELPGLALHAMAARAEELLKERARLLRDVNKKKQQVEQARAAAERELQATLRKMAPLVERHRALVGELTLLFDELLAEGRLSASARKKVGKVRSSLELSGFLSPIADLEEDEASYAAHDPHDPWGEDERDEPWSEPAGAGGAPRAAEDHSVREVASARQPGQERRTLRDIFRSLARAVHPDQARQEPDRERRTEVMKEVTRAYEAGDLARLIELESAWQSERVLTGDGDPELRCRELERINRELLNQVRQLTRELRDVKRAARDASFGPIDQMVEQATRELNEFAAICEFVCKFRDGKIKLAEFVRGPMHAQAGGDDMEQLLESILMAELGYAPARRRSKRRHP